MMPLDKLAPAIVKLQSSLTPVGKSADNPFFKSKYAPLPEVRAALQPLLAANKLALLTFPAIIDGQNGLHFYLIHESGQYIEGQWLLTPAKKDPQGEGSDTTYKQRYALQAITGLVADDDDDGQAASMPPRAPAKTKATSELDQAKDRLRKAIKAAGITGAAAQEYSWVATATDADLDRILGLAEALSMGTVVHSGKGNR